MVELLFVACMVASPDVCEERALQFIDITTQTCTMGAQPRLAEWVGAHPNWRIQAWKCQNTADREIHA